MQNAAWMCPVGIWFWTTLITWLYVLYYVYLHYTLWYTYIHMYSGICPWYMVESSMFGCPKPHYYHFAGEFHDQPWNVVAFPLYSKKPLHSPRTSWAEFFLMFITRITSGKKNIQKKCWQSYIRVVEYRVRTIITSDKWVIQYFKNTLLRRNYERCRTSPKSKRPKKRRVALITSLVWLTITYMLLSYINQWSTWINILIYIYTHAYTVHIYMYTYTYIICIYIRMN